MRFHLSLLFVALCYLPNIAWSQTLIDTDFSKGDFAALGWQPKGAWEVFTYPSGIANQPGPVARFAANQPPGTLTHAFQPIENPQRMVLSLKYGWGWGDAAQGADSVSFMLLNDKRNGYAFVVHRTQANWSVQWGKVIDGEIPKDKHWAPHAIDATHRSLRDGGGLCSLRLTREAGGAWTMRSDAWNQGNGDAIFFRDDSTSSFSQLVLLGTTNSDEQVFNHISLAVPSVEPIPAIPVSEFLNSLGIVTSFPDRGQPLQKTVEMINYCGFRWVRGGIEGLRDSGPTTIDTYLELHKQTGVKFNWGLVSGGTDIKKLIDTAKKLAAVDALLAFEGNNEPNNWGVNYQGEAGGGRAPSWLAVAKLQRDLYQAVKSDPALQRYPVWSISENGGQVDNMGLQFLTIPLGAETKMPEGTKYADFANVHNYIYHPNSAALEDNKTWNASDPTSACKVDGLYGNYGLTWAKKFRGYSESDLLTLPRVTTETGCTIGGEITEEVQALNLLSLYLDQFKRGWKYTSVYLLRDRTDEAGNQTFGFFKPDYTPRKAAVYLHNLTTILADNGTIERPSRLAYTVFNQPNTMHDMLLQKHDGTLELILWNERVTGADQVQIRLARPMKSITIYDPTIGVEPIKVMEGVDLIDLTLSDHPVVLSMIQNPN